MAEKEFSFIWVMEYSRGTSKSAFKGNKRYVMFSILKDWSIIICACTKERPGVFGIWDTSSWCGRENDWAKRTQFYRPIFELGCGNGHWSWSHRLISISPVLIFFLDVKNSTCIYVYYKKKALEKNYLWDIKNHFYFSWTNSDTVDIWFSIS